MNPALPVDPLARPLTGGPLGGRLLGGPRVAAQLDGADLEDFQAAARLLLAHPLVTEVWPRPGALAAVRRWEGVLRKELGRVLGYRLDVGRTCARCYRKAATTSTHRGAFTRTGRLLGPLACSFLCLALAALEGQGEQTTASQLGDEVLRLRAGDDALPVDLTHWNQRKAFVDAVKWLEDRGVLRLCDGAVERWLDDGETGDALYDVDRDTVSRLLAASPSVLADVSAPADFLVDPYAPNDDAQRNRVRHRLGRRLLCEPVVAYDSLDPDELDHVRARRTRLLADITQLTGCHVEARAEGLCLVDTTPERLSAEEFPAGGTEVQAALLWGAALFDAVETAEVDRPEGGCASAIVDAPVAEACWDDVVANYRTKFKVEYRDDPDRLRVVVSALLDRFDLATVQPDGSVAVSAALARFRPSATDDAVDRDGGDAGDQLSLLGGAGEDR